MPIFSLFSSLSPTGEYHETIATQSTWEGRKRIWKMQVPYHR